MHPCTDSKNIRSVFFVTLVICCARANAAAPQLEFGKDILPVFNNHCTACHNQSQSKGDLRLETYEQLMKGGKSGLVIIKGKSDQSPLYLQAAGKDDPIMPPPKNKVGAIDLSAAELDIVKRWIDQGAIQGAPVAINSMPLHWKKLPSTFNPIEAVAVSADGQFAACSRANQVFLYHLPSSSLFGNLSDPALAGNDGASADRDIVSSLAFNPDCTLLAAGGYRSIKLWRRTPSHPLLTIDSAPSTVAFAVSPDGKWIATCGSENKIRVCDSDKGAVVHELSGHAGAVKGLSFSPDSAKLCSISADKTIRVWDFNAGKETTHYQSTVDLNAVTWVDDGKRVAAGCADNLIRIFTLPEKGDWPAAKELKGSSGPITALCAVSPKRLISGSADGSVRVWDAESGNSIQKMDHGAPVTAVAVQSDMKRFASAGGNFAKIWKAENGQAVATIKGDPRAVNAQADAERNAAFQAEQVKYFKSAQQDNEKLLTADTENVKNAEEKAKSAAGELPKKQEAAKKAADAKADAQKAMTQVSDNLKKATDAKEAAIKVAATAAQENKAATEAQNQAKSTAAKATEARVAAEKALEELTKKNDPAKGKTPELESARKTLEAARSAEEKATAAKNSSDKSAADMSAKLKNAEDSKNAATKTFTDLTNQSKDADTKLKAADKALTEANQSLVQAEQAKVAAEQNLERCQHVLKKTQEALAAAKASITAYEASQKQAEAALEAAKKATTDSEKNIRAIVFSPDNRLLFTGGETPAIFSWSAETGKAGETYEAQKEATVGLACLNDGRVVSLGASSKIAEWSRGSEWKMERRIGTGDEKSPLIDRVTALAFSPDGKWLASGGGTPARAGELKIWSPDGNLIREIPDAHSDTVFSVAFSADAHSLASGGADKMVKVFDAQSGKLIKAFEGHTNHVLSVAWKRNGRMLVSGGADKVAKLWDMVTGEQLKTIDGFKKEVTSVSFLEPQNEILIASGDPQVRAAKEDGNKTKNYQSGGEYILSAAATPDEKLFVTGGNDSVLRVFMSGKEAVSQNFAAPAPPQK